MTIAAGQPISAADITAALASKLSAAGGTMTGALVLTADPATPLQAATRQYIDAAAALLNALLTTASTTASAAVPQSGGTMTGALILSGDPSAPLQATTRQYIDAAVAVGPTLRAIGLVLSAAPTARPIVAGLLWINNGVVSLS